MPYFLRHYSTFAEKIHVYDDFSDDTTREVVKSYEPIAELHDTPIKGLDDLTISAIFSTEYRNLSRSKADWVICVDTDELIYCRYLEGVLQAHGEQGFTIAMGAGWQMVSDHIPTTDGQIYEEINEGFPDPSINKACIFKPEIDIHFDPGRHAFRSMGSRLINDPRIRLLHFRYLGEGFNRDRSDRNWERMTKENIDRGYGIHNRRGYRGNHSDDWWNGAMRWKAKVL